MISDIYLFLPPPPHSPCLAPIGSLTDQLLPPLEVAGHLLPEPKAPVDSPEKKISANVFSVPDGLRVPTDFFNGSDF